MAQHIRGTCLVDINVCHQNSVGNLARRSKLALARRLVHAPALLGACATACRGGSKNGLPQQPQVTILELIEAKAIIDQLPRRSVH